MLLHAITPRHVCYVAITLLSHTGTSVTGRYTFNARTIGVTFDIHEYFTESGVTITGVTLSPTRAVGDARHAGWPLASMGCRCYEEMLI